VTTRRRSLAAVGAALAWPLWGSAQQHVRPTPKVFRIGLLEATTQRDNRENFEHFRDGLRDLGYVDGRNIEIHYRSADGRAERFPELAAELHKLPVDIYVVRGTPAALAAKSITTAPIVMAAVADPVAAGLVKTLNKPGGNVTGLATVTRELIGLRVRLLKELLPQATRFGHLVNMSNPANTAQWQDAQTTGTALGMTAVQLDVREPQDFGKAFDLATAEKLEGLVVNVDGLILEHRRVVAEYAAKHKLPAVYADRDFVADGGLLSYGVYYPHLYYRAAGYVGRILRGAKPGELAIERPVRFYLIVNRRTARTLGITVPDSILQRADRAIG
jgi:putative ABC transport system substrate-binding protein